jgi:GNAT superfamily N-acetyltransferase
MANADIVMVGIRELPLVGELFNAVFRPARDVSFFERRLKGRLNPLLLVAQIDRRPVGFAVGYENKPRTFYCWLIGVLPDFRRQGIAAQLMEGLSAWARDNGYHTIRFECFNTQRPMLSLAINQNYDIVGLRYDSDTGQNLLVLEHILAETEE